MSKITNLDAGRTVNIIFHAVRKHPDMPSQTGHDGKTVIIDVRVTWNNNTMYINGHPVQKIGKYWVVPGGVSDNFEISDRWPYPHNRMTGSEFEMWEPKMAELVTRKGQRYMIWPESNEGFPVKSVSWVNGRLLYLFKPKPGVDLYLNIEQIKTGNR